MADSTAGQVPDGENADDQDASSPNADGAGAAEPNAAASTATGTTADAILSDAGGPDGARSNAGELGGSELGSSTARVARIVAALRKAHAEQATAAATGQPADPVAGPGSDTAADLVAATAAAPVANPVAGPGSPAATSEPGSPDAPAPRRESTGVRRTAPTLRWNPGARYRASRLASGPVPQAPPVPAPPVSGPPVPAAAPHVSTRQHHSHDPHRSVPPQAPGPVPPPPAPPGPVLLPPPALAGRLFRGPARRTAVFERDIWYPAARSSRVPRDVGEALVAAVERYRKGSISTSGLVRAIGKAHAA